MGKKKSKAKSNPKMLRKSAQNGASSSGSQPHMPQIQKEAQVYFGKSAIAKGNGIINKGNNAIHAVRWLFENKDALFDDNGVILDNFSVDNRSFLSAITEVISAYLIHTQSFLPRNAGNKSILAQNNTLAILPFLFNIMTMNSYHELASSLFKRIYEAITANQQNSEYWDLYCSKNNLPNYMCIALALCDKNLSGENLSKDGLFFVTYLDTTLSLRSLRMKNSSSITISSVTIVNIEEIEKDIIQTLAIPCMEYLFQNKKFDALFELAKRLFKYNMEEFDATTHTYAITLPVQLVEFFSTLHVREDASHSPDLVEVLIEKLWEINSYQGLIKAIAAQGKCSDSLARHHMSTAERLCCLYPEVEKTQEKIEWLLEALFKVETAINISSRPHMKQLRRGVTINKTAMDFFVRLCGSKQPDIQINFETLYDECWFLEHSEASGRTGSETSVSFLQQQIQLCQQRIDKYLKATQQLDAKKDKQQVTPVIDVTSAEEANHPHKANDACLKNHIGENALKQAREAQELLRKEKFILASNIINSLQKSIMPDNSPGLFFCLSLRMDFTLKQYEHLCCHSNVSNTAARFKIAYDSEKIFANYISDASNYLEAFEKSALSHELHDEVNILARRIFEKMKKFHRKIQRALEDIMHEYNLCKKQVNAISDWESKKFSSDKYLAQTEIRVRVVKQCAENFVKRGDAIDALISKLESLMATSLCSSGSQPIAAESATSLCSSRSQPTAAEGATSLFIFSSTPQPPIVAESATVASLIAHNINWNTLLNILETQAKKHNVRYWRFLATTNIMSYLLFGIEVAFETEMILDKLRISALATKPEYVLACFHCSIPNSLPLKLSEFDDFNNEPFKKYYRIIGPTKQQNKVYPHQRWFKKAVVAPQETPQWDLTTVSNSKNLPNLSNHQATP